MQSQHLQIRALESKSPKNAPKDKALTDKAVLVVFSNPELGELKRRFVAFSKQTKPY